jgi:RNA polymerase sigma-70 factor, ECF subfamily
MNNQANPLQLQLLLRSSAKGDQNAFQQLYELSSTNLFSVALCILRRQDWAEDVLQECYVRIWHHAADYDETKSAPLTWMISIVRNSCIDNLRRAGVRPLQLGGEEIEDSLENIIEPALGPQEMAQQHQTVGRIEKCLEQLAAPARKNIELAFFYGYSHIELAELQKQAVGTVKSLIRRGLASLKNCLGVA